MGVSDPSSIKNPGYFVFFNAKNRPFRKCPCLVCRMSAGIAIMADEKESEMKAGDGCRKHWRAKCESSCYPTDRC